MTSRGKGAARTALAAVALAAGVPCMLPSARPGPEAADEATRGDGGEARPADRGYVELQRQLNELRSDLLDEREQRIGRQLEANGTVLVVLGIVIGVAGPALRIREDSRAGRRSSPTVSSSRLRRT